MGQKVPAAVVRKLFEGERRNLGLCSIYQVTKSLELRHKERNNVLSLRNNERWHLTWYIGHHPKLFNLSYLNCL